MPDEQPHSTKGDRNVEYQQTIAYVHHMYDTRHRIFQFAIAVNAGLLAIVFQMADSPIARAVISVMGCAVMVFMTLLAKRSNLYLNELEEYAKELETSLGFHMVRLTTSRMPKGITSTSYLFYSYWLMVVVWSFLLLYFALKTFGLPLPQM